MSQNLITPSMHEGELRILDIDLGKRLGFAKPVKIRELIKRHLPSLEQMGTVPTVGTVKRGQDATEYYLNRKQAIFITAKSETAEATDITIEIIERFDAYERGEARPEIAKPKRIRKTPIDTRFIQLKRIALASGKDEGQAVICANTGVLNETGYNALEMMGIKALPIESDEHYYTPTDLGAEFGMSGREVNQILKRAGLQTENPAKSSTASNWLPTEMGKRYGRMQDGVRSNGKGSTQTLMWKKDAASFLRPFAKTPA